MNDVTFCSGLFCPLKKGCKRYVLGCERKRDEHLGIEYDTYTWWMNPEYDVKNNMCDNFLKH